MRIGIIDADLLGRTKHRFPNLACEKISGYWIEKGAETVLLRDYDHISDYDKVYISKVFTDTPVPQWILDDTLRPSSVHIGGIGFFFDQAPSLPIEIEHHMPDYRLYASLASLMSLASISKMERKLVYPTSLGHFLIDYQINEKNDI